MASQQRYPDEHYPHGQDVEEALESPPPPRHRRSTRNDFDFVHIYHNDTPDGPSITVLDDPPRNAGQIDREDHPRSRHPVPRQGPLPNQGQDGWTGEQSHFGDESGQYSSPQQQYRRDFQERGTVQPNFRQPEAQHHGPLHGHGVSHSQGGANFIGSESQYADPRVFFDDLPSSPPPPQPVSPRARRSQTKPDVPPQGYMEPEHRETRYNPFGSRANSEHAEEEHFCEKQEELCNDIKGLKRKLWPVEVANFGKLDPKTEDEFAEAGKMYEKLLSEFDSLNFTEDEQKMLEKTQMSLRCSYMVMRIRYQKHELPQGLLTDIALKCMNEDAEEYRRVYRLWSDVLRAQDSEKYLEREDWLRKTWPGSSQGFKMNLNLWRLENGAQLCALLEEQCQFNKASLLRTELWRDMQAVREECHKDTVQAGLLAVQCTLKQLRGNSPSYSQSHYRNEASKILKDIWELWKDEQNRSQAMSGILTGGRMLGHLYYCENSEEKTLEAKAILEVVWEARKAQSQVLEDTMLTGHYLFLTYVRLRQFSRAKIIFAEVWNAVKFIHKSTPKDSVLNAYHLSNDCLNLDSANEAGTGNPAGTPESQAVPEILGVRFQIGMMFFRGGERKQAECILRGVYNSYKAAKDFGPRHQDTLLCGRYLGEAAARLELRAQAAEIFHEILAEWTALGPQMERKEVMESRSLYSDLLITRARRQANAPDEIPTYNQAVDILDSMLPPDAEADNTLAFEVFEKIKCGHNLLIALIKTRKFDRAEQVLDNFLDYAPRGRSAQLKIVFPDLGKLAMEANQHKMAAKIFKKFRDIQEALEDWNGASEAAYYLGLCYEEQKKLTAAKGAYVAAQDFLKKPAIHNRLAKAIKDLSSSSRAKSKRKP